MARLDQAEAARLYFGEYIRFVHGWEPRPHQLEWIAALQELAYGRLRHAERSVGCQKCQGMVGCSPEHQAHKLAIKAPPGSGKTAIMTEFAAWMIGRSILKGEIPQMGYICFGDDPAMARSVAIRDTISDNRQYKALFPAVPDKSKGWGQKEWYLKRHDPGDPFPTMRAAGITGGILSYRFKTLGVIDDPHDGKNLTPGVKMEAWSIYQNSIKTRLLEGTPLALICTRFADDDLIGRIEKTEKDWLVIHTKALVDDKSYWSPEEDTGLGISVESLKEIQRVSPLSFLTQYQAMPPSSEGDIFKWWAYAPQRPHLTEVTQVYQVWDTASTMHARKNQSSNVGITGLMKTNNRLYIDDIYKEQKAPAETSRDMASLFEKSQSEWGDKTYVVVENKSSGTALVSFLQAFSSIGPRIIARDIPGGGIGSGQRGQLDPVNRAAAISHIFESGMVELPLEWRPWKDEYIAALSAFPNGEQGPHNDQVLATILLLEHAFPAQFRGAPPDVRVRVRGINY